MSFFYNFFLFYKRDTCQLQNEHGRNYTCPYWAVECASSMQLSQVESQLNALCRGHGIGQTNCMVIDDHALCRGRGIGQINCMVINDYVEFSKDTNMSYK